MGCAWIQVLLLGDLVNPRHDLAVELLDDSDERHGCC